MRDKLAPYIKILILGIVAYSLGTLLGLYVGTIVIETIQGY